MNALLIAARAVHYAAAIVLFGELVFYLVVAEPARREAGHPADADGCDSDVLLRLRRVALWGIVASLVSGAAWLAAEAALMSGRPLAQALTPDTLGLVLGKTTFGRVWLLRLGIAIGLGMLMAAMGRADNRQGSSRLAAAALALAATYLAALAWVGHASGGQGLQHAVQIASDAFHLLAAGAWLGALPGLVYVLRRAPSPELAARATQRFSTLGLVSVSVLVATGLIIAWYLVGTLPALFGTEYGRLLLGKLTLFALMVSLAAVNRTYLMPRMIARNRIAPDQLRRNALWETMLGIGVVLIVAVLGVTSPERHHRAGEPMAHVHSP